MAFGVRGDQKKPRKGSQMCCGIQLGLSHRCTDYLTPCQRAAAEGCDGYCELHYMDKDRQERLKAVLLPDWVDALYIITTEEGRERLRGPKLVDPEKGIYLKKSSEQYKKGGYKGKRKTPREEPEPSPPAIAEAEQRVMVERESRAPGSRSGLFPGIDPDRILPTFGRR